MRIFSKGYRFCLTKDQVAQALSKYYKKNDLLFGHCDEAGTEKYKSRFENVHPDHWKSPQLLNEKINLSSLGIGTQNGQPSNQEDYPMFHMLHTSLTKGINSIDTCTNFRYGKSEKVINAVLNYLVAENGYSRNQFFVGTKCGFIPQDVDSNLDDEGFVRILKEQNIASDQDIVENIHCVSPKFIEFSCEKSRLALGLETIDLLYLNNFPEAELSLIGKQKYDDRLKRAFEAMEELRHKNKIRYYGMACFVSFRSPPSEEGIHISMAQTIKVAKEIGGQNHGFRFIEVPFNLGMPETLLKWQPCPETNTNKNIFEICQDNKINVNVCCPLFQGRIVNLPFKSQKLNGIKNIPAKHLQLVRSINSSSIVSTIFGTQNYEHALQNLEAISHPLLTTQEWNQILPIPK